MGYSIKDHLAYNLWATRLIAEALQPLDEELLNRELKSSFPGIAKTIMHLWDSQFIWLMRLQGESKISRPSATFEGIKDELLAGFISSSENVVKFINSKEDGFTDMKIAYQLMNGDKYENVISEIIFHMVNHGTYHRGQIITMLRELGVTTVPNTDLIRFTWLKEK